MTVMWVKDGKFKHICRRCLGKAKPEGRDGEDRLLYRCQDCKNIGSRGQFMQMSNDSKHIAFIKGITKIPEGCLHVTNGEKLLA